MRQLFQLAGFILVIIWVLWVTGQARKPSGWLGRRVVGGMNLSHSTLTDWGLKQLSLQKNAAVLDVGCGGGRTVQKLAALAPEGTVVGIDVSKASVAVSRQTNVREIESGRVRIELGSVASLPFPDRIFDAVTAVETHYYWPDLQANVREVLRVLKPGGTFALIAETYRGGRSSALYWVAMRLLLRAAFLSDSEHRALLTQAGFTRAETFHAPRESWICAIGARES
jgi:SAM-dependent methyltransferase